MLAKSIFLLTIHEVINIVWLLFGNELYMGILLLKNNFILIIFFFILS